jgi:hypothetical protein
MKLNNEQLEQLVDYLQGTCLSLWEATREVFDVDQDDIENEMELCDFIDDRIFLCRECGWWYENGYWNLEGLEPGNGEICLDCMPEEDD